MDDTWNMSFDFNQERKRSKSIAPATNFTKDEQTVKRKMDRMQKKR